MYNGPCQHLPDQLAHDKNTEGRTQRRRNLYISFRDKEIRVLVRIAISRRYIFSLGSSSDASCNSTEALRRICKKQRDAGSNNEMSRSIFGNKTRRFSKVLLLVQRRIVGDFGSGYNGQNIIHESFHL